MLSMGRGFPSNPLRIIFAWEESCEGLEAAVKRKKRRVVRMIERVILIFFIMVYRYGMSIGWIEACGKKLFMENERKGKQWSLRGVKIESRRVIG